MRKVYADNGSTSFPKAPGVSDAVKKFLDDVGANIGRGGYESSYGVAADVYAVRHMLCRLFNFNNPRNVIFTPGITYSLNMILQGFLKSGDHVITTNMEHNSMMRPLHALAAAGMTYDVADPACIEKYFKQNTRAVVMTHASNVCGKILPIYDILEMCKARGVKLIIDAAQTAGVVEIDMAKGIDALTFTAHKGLLGPQGLGGFIVRDDLAADIDPIITGGTGSASHDIIQPSFLPDKFESGTLNIPAIIGLKASLEYILSVGIKAIYEKEMHLTARFIAGVGDIKGVEIAGESDTIDRVAVVSLDFLGMDNAEVAGILDTAHGIMTRCGLHCSPAAHKALGTYPHGTVRFSFGHLNTTEEIDYIIDCIKEIVSDGF